MRPLISALLLAAAGAVYAQGKTEVVCNATFDWMQNDNQQNPCFVTANLLQPCNDNHDEGTDISPPPPREVYPVPGTGGLNATPCACSSVTYTGLAACAACQNLPYPPWADWIMLCAANETSVATYPDPLLVDVPAWMFADPTDADGGGGFNLTRAFALAFSNTTNSKAAVSAAGPTPTPSPGPTSPPAAPPPASASTTHHSSNVGAIVGGVLGGLGGLLLLGAVAMWWLRARRASPTPSHERLQSASTGGTLPPPAFTGTPSTFGNLLPPGSPGSLGTFSSTAPAWPAGGVAPTATPGSPGSLGATISAPASPDPRPKLYNPDDPSTFPPSLQSIQGGGGGARDSYFPEV